LYLRARLGLFRIAKVPEPFLCMGLGIAVEWCVVNIGRWSRDLSVIRGGVEVDDMQTVLEELDSRNKRLSLDAVLI
jgi:hypothetical protein